MAAVFSSIFSFNSAKFYSLGASALEIARPNNSYIIAYRQKY